MYRLTTPEHTFTLPENASNYDVIQITYKQGQLKLVKQKDETSTSEGMTINGKNVVVALTQAETKKFKKGTATVQLRALSTLGKAYASSMFTFTVEEVNNEDILV